MRNDSPLIVAPPMPAWAKHYLKIAVVAAVYYVTARLSLTLAFEKTNASPVWPPSGIAFAAVLLAGSRIWPGILAGSVLANVHVFLLNQSSDIFTVLQVSTFMGIGNTLEAVSGPIILRRFGVQGDPLDRLGGVFKFVIVAFLMCLVSSLIGPTGIVIAGVAPWAQYGTIWFTWWLGNTAGVLVVTPLILSWIRQPIVRWTPRQCVELACLAVMLIMVSSIALGEWLQAHDSNYPLSFLIIPMLMWAALRFGRRIAITAVGVTSGIALWAAINGSGPFARVSANEALLLLQAFIGVVTVTMLAMAATVAERRKAEESLNTLNKSLRRRAEELARSNSELEQFAYVASHDLQEPLRMVTSYVQLLEGRYKERLDAKADKYFAYAIDGAQRMQAMIKDLLRYSRVGRADDPLRPVDCATPLTAALLNLKLVIEETGAEITADRLPRIMGDPLQVAQLFQNLLENAIKFSREGPPRVHIGCERKGDEWVVSVRDNGIGIEPQHAEQIFQIFRRLHEHERYSGTGIGLAITRKIVERHGGRIWVESSPGSGSTFRFTLPVYQESYEVIGMGSELSVNAHENNPSGLYSFSARSGEGRAGAAHSSEHWFDRH